MRKTKGKRVQFTFSAEPASWVYVAGTFNDWDPERNRMRSNPGTGEYRTSLVLPPGRHEYKFVVNGEWHVDPNCADWVPNSHGSLNSVICV